VRTGIELSGPRGSKQCGYWLGGGMFIPRLGSLGLKDADCKPMLARGLRYHHRHLAMKESGHSLTRSSLSHPKVF
jgi:hypothetical protein